MMDLTKTPLNEYGHVQTRDGRPVRLLCVDAKLNSLPVTALVQHHPEKEIVLFVDIDGSANGRNGDKSNLDLIPVPRKHTVSGWLCVMKEGSAALMFSEPDYDAMRVLDIVAMREITVELTEGEGLE